VKELGNHGVADKNQGGRERMIPGFVLLYNVAYIAIQSLLETKFIDGIF